MAGKKSSKGSSTGSRKQNTRTTQRTPSGAQQYVRGNTPAERLGTIRGALETADRAWSRALNERDRTGPSGTQAMARAERELSEAHSDQLDIEYPRRYRTGGSVCRGMGAAKRGGKYKR
jgi:hypothetical protein